MTASGRWSRSPVIGPIVEARAVLGPAAIALWLTSAFFVGAPAWNQNSRLALTRAIVEDGTVAIDRFHATTGDKAFRDGHYYSDKAPGTSWLAVPAYAAFFAVRRATGGELPDVRVQPLDPRDEAAGRFPDPEARAPGDRLVYNAGHRLALWWCTVTTVGLMALLGAAAVFLLVRRVADVAIARRIAITTAIATPLLPYATALYGHVPCAAALVAAFAIVFVGDARRSHALAFGALAAVAVITEYPAAVPAALLWLVGARRHGPRYAVTSAIAAAPFALTLAIYHTAAFGHPLRTGYDFVVGETFSQGMAVRYGIALPDPEVAFALLFSSYRGLFYLAPILLLAVWGLAHDLWHARGDRRTIAVLALVIAIYYWLLNASYYMWDGGAAIGPRHMIPMLGFLALGLPTPAQRVPRLFAALAIASGVQMFIAAAGTPESPQWGNPIWEHAIDGLLQFEPAPGGHATNLGRLLGLPGPLSLLPLFAAWAWARAQAQKRPDSDSPVARPSKSTPT